MKSHHQHGKSHFPHPHDTPVSAGLRFISELIAWIAGPCVRKCDKSLRLFTQRYEPLQMYCPLLELNLDIDIRTAGKRVEHR